MAGQALEIYVEQGAKRAFAAALEWPGLVRGGRDEQAAIAALTAAIPRYARVAEMAGLEAPAASRVEVLERLRGDATTDFGAPGQAAERDRRPLGAAEADRQAALLEAAWRLLAEVAAAAPAELRKGPRGGGRDRDPILDHVAGAEEMYARKIGIRPPAAQRGVDAIRAAILEVVRRPSDGGAPDRGWPVRYAARRIAWHVLDHAWEIEDRS